MMENGLAEATLVEAMSALFSLWILSILHLMVTVQEISFWEGGEKVCKTKESKIKATVCNGGIQHHKLYAWPSTPRVGPFTFSSLSTLLPPHSSPNLRFPEASGHGV